MYYEEAAVNNDEDPPPGDAYLTNIDSQCDGSLHSCQMRSCGSVFNFL